MNKRILTSLMCLVLCFSLVSPAFADISIGTDGSGNVDIVKPDTGGGNNNNNNNTGGGDSYVPPADPTYSVSASANAGGTVSTDKANAKKGDTVTITVTPNGGYRVDGLTVKDAKGNDIAVTDLGGGKYSFVMPDGKVSVNAAFVADTPAPQVTFTDVPADAFYADAVAWAVENGITNGTSATQFSPNQTCTRAQTVTFLWRAAGSPKASSTNSPFTDVAPGTYYYDAVLWAVENGITNGTGATTFSPDDTVTRGQVVTFQYRAAKAQATTGNNPFVDVDGSAYYADAVQWAVNNSVTNGTSTTTFSPNEGCTRGQIVTFLYRAR